MGEPLVKLHAEEMTMLMIEVLIYDRKHFLITRAYVPRVVVTSILLTILWIVKRHTGSITVNVILLIDALLHRTPIRVPCARRVSQGIIFQILINLALSALVTQIQLLMTIPLVHVMRSTTTAKISSTSLITNAQLKSQTVGYTWCEIVCEGNQYAFYSDMSTLTPADLST